MNENVMVKEYEFDKPVIQNIDSIIDNYIRDCHQSYFYTFDHICLNDIQLTNITNSEIVSFTISAKSMASYELNRKITVAQENGFMFNQINELTKKIYSSLSHMNIHYYLKLQIPIMHRHFFTKLSQNPEYIQTHCNERRNPIHFACRLWYLYSNPHC